MARKNQHATSVIRKRLWCSTLEREAEIEVLVKDGSLCALRRCSLIPGFDILDCRKCCLEQVRGMLRETDTTTLLVRGSTAVVGPLPLTSRSRESHH